MRREKTEWKKGKTFCERALLRRAKLKGTLTAGFLTWTQFSLLLKTKDAALRGRRYIWSRHAGSPCWRLPRPGRGGKSHPAGYVSSPRIRLASPAFPDLTLVGCKLYG